MGWWWIVVAVGIIWWFWTRDRHFPYQERAEKISQAMRDGLDISMIYWAKSSRKYSNRVVTPLALDGVYMRAFDHWRKAERTFKVTRIKEINLVPRASKTEGT